MTVPEPAPAMREPGRVQATDPVPDQLTFTCPRCGTDVHERWYGPCSSCRDTLRATVAGQARHVATADYEPKMNVTPNAVATKD